MIGRLDIYDLIVALGLVLLGAGLWLIWPALALATVGGLLVAIGLAAAFLRARGPRG
jgi:hypothetical protein